MLFWTWQNKAKGWTIHNSSLSCDGVIENSVWCLWSSSMQISNNRSHEASFSKRFHTGQIFHLHFWISHTCLEISNPWDSVAWEYHHLFRKAFLQLCTIWSVSELNKPTRSTPPFLEGSTGHSRTCVKPWQGWVSAGGSGVLPGQKLGLRVPSLHSMWYFVIFFQWAAILTETRPALLPTSTVFVHLPYRIQRNVEPSWNLQWCSQPKF